jgi:hypothetical protein
MTKRPIINPREVKSGQRCWLYETRADRDLCYAHILHVLPHPENPDDKLIVFRWFGIHKRWWWYGVTSMSYQELYLDLTTRKVKKIYENEQ